MPEGISLEYVGPGELTTKPCVIATRKGDGAREAICAVDDLPDARVDEVFDHLRTAMRSCLWPPMWQQKEGSVAHRTEALRATEWRAINHASVDVLALPGSEPDRRSVVIAVTEVKPQ
jgi:hypothetical protein